MNNLLVNPKTVLFHDGLDKRNNFYTIVCNPKTEIYLKVNPLGYKILRTLEENLGVTVVEISKITGIEKETINKFVLAMKKENVIFEK